MNENDTPEDREDHDIVSDPRTVRPRWTWLGLLLLLIGLVLVAWGLMAQSWPIAVPGLVALALGAVLGWYGGIFYDVQSSPSVQEQVHDVVEGNAHEVPGPGTKRSHEALKRENRQRRGEDG